MAIHHFSAMLLFSFLTSVVFGVISKDTPRGRVLYAAKSFGLFVGIALLLGWVMYPFPR
jgi:flagellar biosynthesis protein FliR